MPQHVLLVHRPTAVAHVGHCLPHQPDAHNIQLINAHVTQHTCLMHTMYSSSTHTHQPDTYNAQIITTSHKPCDQPNEQHNTHSSPAHRSPHTSLMHKMHKSSSPHTDHHTSLTHNTTDTVHQLTDTQQPIAQNAQVTDHRQLTRTITSMTKKNTHTQFINSYSITGLLLLARSPSKQNKFFLLLQSPVGHENCQPHLEVFSGPDGRVTQGQVA